MKKRGFTLIELIVVMAIISILVLLGVPKYKTYTEEARITKLTVETKELEKASQQYYIRNSDWPRLSNEPYSKEEVVAFGERIYSSTGKIVELEDGNYYDIDYAKLSNYISKPSNSENYILQNPVGNVYSLYGLTETGKTRVENDVIVEEPIEESDLNQLVLGQFVQFGKHLNGEPIKWNVVKIDNGNVMLFMAEPIKNTDGTYLIKQFDMVPNAGEPTNSSRNTYGSNNYKFSDIRYWLNNDFLNSTFINTSIIADTSNEYILADIDAGTSTNSHVYNTTFSNSLLNYDTANKDFVTDKIYLPNIKELVEYIQPVVGNAYYGSYRYWTRDSYAAYLSSVRIVYSSGSLLTYDANSYSSCVRAALTLKSGKIISGDGSQSSPYVIE